MIADITKIVSLEEVCISGSSNVAQRSIVNNEGEYAIFGASGFIKNVDFYHQEKPYLSIVKDGSGYGRVTKMDSKTSVIGTLQYILPKDNINLSYLHYALLSIDFKKYVSGAAIPHIYFRDYKKEKIALPPLPIQHQIVEKLDAAFEAIDQAKANLEKNIQNAKELFQSKLNQTFSQKGEGWEERKLGEVCENLDSKRIPITKNRRSSGEIPYYGASGIVDFVDNYIFDGDYLLVSEDGANLIMRTYPIAFSVSGKIWVNNHAHILKFNNINTQKYFEYYLNSIKLDDYISGMAQPKLNQAKLNLISIPLPTSLETQQQIVLQLDALSQQTNLLQEKYRQKLQNLEELRKSILEKAFKGELVQMSESQISTD